ncbi:MAG: hypothetical protein ONB48_14995 [candidate division KSB1 bacterium]|nr:hypothetical protein [candidate division KSB1 bacterium]MDZ7273455.1 hypothetical protein [candidate division KSB1 bacterium]MDZ7286953.1 hypothetical protein [candidate division KSB1 bacterium]MDZ7299694.1 hypothetical protein [candidate division KSB1 bacterium]MDZ7308708.1 hypothetical protein [candidate division KSB1 bacterium]
MRSRVRSRRRHWRLLWVVALLACSGCAALQQMQDALLNVKRLQFKLDGVVPGTLAGVSLAKIDDPASLNLQDGIRLTSAFAQKSLPMSFTLNVAAKNPNDGSGGSPQKTAVLTALAWTLKIDDQETITGDLGGPIEIPGTGQATIIPLHMSLDLYQFFGERGYMEVLNLALAIAGKQGNAARLTLAATPTVTVAGLPLKYPGAIHIVDKEFTNP